MPHKCVVPLCSGNYASGPKAATFGFPDSPDLRNKWICAIKRKNFVPTKHSRVCELHFKESDFQREASAYDPKTGRTLTAPLSFARIKKGAVPSLFVFPKPPEKSLNKELPEEGIRLEDEQVSHAVKQNITSISPQNSKNVPESNLSLENKNEKNPKKKRGKRKRKLSGGTTSNQVNGNSKNCHLNQVTSSNENATVENHGLSNSSQFLPTVCIKVEAPWEKEYNYVGNSSGDKSKDSDKVQIEIRDVRSVVSSENKSNSGENVDKNSGTISESFSTSVLAKPLKISKREETFGKLVASEISDLSENPELYIRTKQAILNILVQAHFEQMKFS